MLSKVVRRLLHKHSTELRLVNKKYYRLQIRQCNICGKWFEYDKFEDRLSPLNIKGINLDEWDRVSQ